MQIPLTLPEQTTPQPTRRDIQALSPVSPVPGVEKPWTPDWLCNGLSRCWAVNQPIWRVRYWSASPHPHQPQALRPAPPQQRKPLPGRRWHKPWGPCCNVLAFLAQLMALPGRLQRVPPQSSRPPPSPQDLLW